MIEAFDNLDGVSVDLFHMHNRRFALVDVVKEREGCCLLPRQFLPQMMLCHHILMGLYTETRHTF